MATHITVSGVKGFSYSIYSEDELGMDPEVVAAWQFDDEVQYQAALATSYPQDTTAREAAQWLRGQGQWQ